jgi:hypothetical protein
VRVIGIVRDFQDSLHIASHDTRPVEIQNSVRSRLRRNANYYINIYYHTGTHLYGCRDDVYFSRLARHIDEASSPGNCFPQLGPGS